ncbi:MAG: sensor histidine kinase [Mucilaginibacter sp.]|jgi:two-component sensor histidine kinase|uniref:tetratricopeptide repeat-containing sensor histidine kinase n=1 Tax=Mucilaginibacter sp. TaxID=1882438 RepID=UPI003568335F
MKKIAFAVLLLFILKPVKAQDPYNTLPQEVEKFKMKIQKSKPDTNRISLQVKLACYYVFKPGEEPRDLDSALIYFNEANSLSKKLQAKNWIYEIAKFMGNYYSERGEYKKSQQNFMTAISYYEKLGDDNKMADVLSWLGDWYTSTTARDSMQVTFFRRAAFIYEKKRRPEKVLGLLIKIAERYIRIKQLTSAEIELKKALVEYNTTDKKASPYLFSTLSYLEYFKGNYYRALSYSSEGIKNMLSAKDTTEAWRLYASSARANFAIKSYEEALKFYRKTLVATNNKMRYQWKIVQCLIFLNKPEQLRLAFNELMVIKPDNIYDLVNKYTAIAKYYNSVHQYDKALQYFNKLFNPHPLVRLPDDEFFRNKLFCDYEISRIYLKLNNLDSARHYLWDADTTLQKTKTTLDPLNLVDFYDVSHQYNIAIGNYRGAVKFMDLRNNLRDSLFTVDKNNKIAELNIQYQTAQTAQSIKDLRQRSVIQQAGLEKAKLQRNVTIAGILIMLIVSGLIYRNYGLKQRANKLISIKNEQLQHLLTEKEWLLKEVHHRVKNNLHTVICLLESQARYLENDALQAIESSQHRIYAMSLIHQKLYQSDDIKTIDMANYIPELVQSLIDGFGTAENISFKLNIESIKLSLSHAIPLALIINEAVTNSIKYAFPNSGKGEISISLTNNKSLITLELADNGIGMPEIDHKVDAESLGLRLIQGLSEDIDAQTNFQINNGTIITIMFKPDP